VNLTLTLSVPLASCNAPVIVLLAFEALEEIVEDLAHGGHVLFEDLLGGIFGEALLKDGAQFFGDSIDVAHVDVVAGKRSHHDVEFVAQLDVHVADLRLRSLHETPLTKDFL